VLWAVMWAVLWAAAAARRRALLALWLVPGRGGQGLPPRIVVVASARVRAPQRHAHAARALRAALPTARQDRQHHGRRRRDERGLSVRRFYVGQDTPR